LKSGSASCRPQRRRSSPASCAPRATVEGKGEEAEEPEDDEDEDSEEDSEEDDDDSTAADDQGDTDFVDGSEAGGRRLSKAERKRLKKLARMNGHAA